MANVTLQDAILSQIKFDLNALNEKPPDQISESYLKSILKDLEETYSSSKLLHASLITSEESREIKEYKNKGIFAQIRTAYHSLWSKIDMLMPSSAPIANETLNQTILNNTTTHAEGFSSSGVKLPRLDIPKFNGNYNQWKNFYNLFVSTIHEDRKLRPVQKLQYLLSSVTDAAKDLIKNYDLEDENYDLALNALKDEYDHKRLLANTHLHTLFSLPVLKNEFSGDIKTMIHTTRQCLVSLENLGLDTSSWDAILIFILQQKLPQKTHQLWEDKLGSSTEIPKYIEFKEFLESRFRSLEMMEMKAPNASQTNSRSSGNKSPVFHVASKPNNKQKSFSVKCTSCSGEHKLSRCQSFLQLSVENRYQFVVKNKLCFNCLSSSHQFQKCYSTFTCKVCKVKHHTLLHDHFVVKQNAQGISTSSSNEEHLQNVQVSGPRVYHIKSNCHKVKLLGTAQLYIFNHNGESVRIRALVDPGSDESYITESTLQILGIHKYHCPTSISVLGDLSVGECKFRSDFKIASTINSFSTHLSALVVSTITSELPSEAVCSDEFEYLHDLDLADPSYNRPGEINMLLGVTVYADIRRKGFRSGGLGKPIAENSHLGWLIRGDFESDSSNYNRPSVSFFTASSSQIDFDLERFFKLEEVNVVIPKRPDDELCEQIFLNSVVKCPDGRFSVDLPFKGNQPPVLGESRTIALRRFLSLERKLNANNQLKRDYHDTIKDYLDLGHMVLDDQDCSDVGHEYVMPHHAVFKQSSSTTKTRVVFDASCHTQDGTSLNNHLLPGSKLQPDIKDILFLWRRYQFVFTADIARMYRQFWINPNHHSFQKIYWRFSESEPIQLYCLTTVTFGTTSAPFLAIRLLIFFADSDEAREFPLASEALKSEFYVDDLLSGAHDRSVAINKQQQIRKLLASAKLNIRKWCSNFKDIISDIPDCDREDSVELEFDHDDNFRKTLGIFWSPDQDCFSFSVGEDCLAISEFTKRNILSIISRVFDPLGLISPCVMHAKNIMKLIWKSGCGWDEEVSDRIKESLITFLSQLPKLKDHVIPRWIKTENDHDTITLYGFSDASEIGYGAVVYIRDPLSRNKLILLTSKTKVAPAQFTSIARLELCAAVLLAQLLQWAQNLFKQNVIISAFTDSKIVLAWLHDHPSRWKTFVANRTTQILEITSPNQWHYIDTKLNPADLASRGLLPSDLVHNDLWWSGPPTDSLFDLQFETDCHDDKVIEKEKKSNKICMVTKAKSQYNDLLERYSSTSKLMSIIELCSKFISNCLSRMAEKHPKNLTYQLIVDGLRSSEVLLFRNLQAISFDQELQCLIHNEPLDKHSKLLSLNPFIDGVGILRVGGRLHFANDLTFEQKHPIIIPAKHQVTANLIREAHKLTQHGNCKETLAYIRQKFYFFRMSDRIKYYIRNCVSCFKFQKQLKNELMGSLPPARVNTSRPFLHTGVDYAGPLSVKVWRGKIKTYYKAWVAIYICLCTKAIHIELITDLSSEGFLASFKRMTSRRGRVIKLYSDQGSNFVGASKELNRDFQIAQRSWQEELQSTLSQLGTSWFFIPPASPHFGGLWEAGVRAIKAHLYRISNDIRFTYEELNTLLVQIEGVLNSRPLCSMSDNADDYNALTPSHFLIGEPIISHPERSFEMSKISCLKRWQYIQKLFQQFWHSWSHDYLHSLQQRTKWKTQQERPFKLNDLVLVTHENYPPSLWPTARIIELHPGNDNINRVVSLRYSDGHVKRRPITKLVLVPVEPDTSLE